LAERDLLFAEADVEAVERVEGVPGGADAHDAGRADVEDADFAALEEKARAGFLGAGQRQRGVVGTAAPTIMRSRSV
jgi:hypothetical protein